MLRVQLPAVTPKRKPWNKRRIIGQERPLLLKQVWAIRARLELAGNLLDLTFSTPPSTANYVEANWWNSPSLIWSKMAACGCAFP